VCWTDNPPLVPAGIVGRVVTTGTSATHRYACHNPPTAEEALAGRPLREGFMAAQPPGTIIERLLEADDVPPLAAEEVALFDRNAVDLIAPLPPDEYGSPPGKAR
jgi:hypothetical protein